MFEYSKGLETQVYVTDAKQRSQYPFSDLVRMDQTRNITGYACLFYRHKIAELLFPENFIKVTGTQTDLPLYNQQLEDYVILDAMNIPQPLKRTLRLFSRLAPIPQEHATYASHFTPGKFGGKEACKCPVCLKHQDFHKVNGLQQLADQVGEKTAAIGIFVPSEDTSDYCSTGQDIIFFEIDYFDSSLLSHYLVNQKSRRSPDEEYALQLLNRYCELEFTERKIHYRHPLIPK